MDGEDNTTPTTNTPQFPPHFYHPNPFSSARNTTFPPASALSPAPVEPVKKKRGRPRKYGIGAASVSPSLGSSSSSVKKSQSASGSLLFSRSPGAAANSSLSEKKKEAPGRGEAASSSPKKPQIGSLGQGFTPHVIIVNNGEDVAQRIIQFMQQAKRAICILSASGSISSASLRQPAAYGGQMTIEGRYEITSLSGSFLPAEHIDLSRIGGLSVCLSGLDISSLVGGGVCGPLIAAGSVTVIAGSFSVDITDVGPSSVKTGEAVPINQGSTLVTPVAFRPSIGSTERVSGAGIGDDQRGTGGSDYFMQPNLINMNFMAHQWRGSLEGPSRTSHSTEEDIKSDGS
ncbi:putative DNA-binding ESCAROLA -like protein [Carex littledalei]|uniref:AT-hook motif nuclear-localized protein n=1 Tax=Carex littledalei TaxID=544730 RepID=A0A833VUW7_9POAL|nr:putative DNA-binding ESCAROLA -like protein [Carex littledalei]